MFKRKSVHCSEEPPKKVTKITNDDGLDLYVSPMLLKDMAAIRVSIALWYHQNLRNILRKDGYDGPWYRDESIESDDGDLSNPRETSHHRNSSEEEIGPMEHERAYQSYYDGYAEAREKDFTWNCVEGRAVNDVCKLPVPSAVQEMVQQYMEPIKKNFKKWVMYHHKRIFFPNHLNCVYSLVDEAEWKCDGEVDYEKTARNLLSSPKINDIEKYRLICTYCMEDEIPNVSPKLFSQKYIENVRFDGHPLIYYWNAYVKGQLLKLPLDHFSSVDARMISSKHIDNQSALQYFWNRLDEDEKLESAKLLVRHFGARHLRFLLLQLSDIHRYHILLEMGPEMVIIFAKNSFCDQAVQIWSYIQNLVKAEELTEAILQLLNFAWNDYSNSPENTTYIISLVRHLWRSASNHVKSVALDYRQSKIINLLLNGTRISRYQNTDYLIMGSMRTNFEENFKLFCELLSDASADFREEVIKSEIWRSHYVLLTKKGKTEFLDYFVKLCFPKGDAKANDLKKYMLNTEESRNSCLNLLKQNKLDEFNKYISLYLPDTRSIADYQVELMMSDKGIATFAESFNINNYKSLHTTIHKILNQEDVATQFKRKMILSTSSVCQHFHSWIEQGQWEKVNDCLELFMPDENDTEMVKQTLLRSYQGERMSKVFAHCNEAQWRDFLLWCLGDAQLVSQFKKSIPFDAIFTILLQQSVFFRYDSKLSNCKLKPNCDFTEIDRFLRWFFVKDENVKKFKVSQILEFRDIGVVNTLSRKKDDEYIKAVLNWFFEGDDTVIQVFKSKYKRLKISSVLI